MSYRQNRTYNKPVSQVRYDEYLETLNGYVTESAVNTFTQSELSTPVGRAGNLAMCIHGIMTEPSGTMTHGAENDAQRFVLNSVSGTGISTILDSNMIYKRTKTTHWATSVGFQIVDQVSERWFKHPVLYAKSKLFLQTQGVNQGAVATWYVRIYYTIRKVSLYKMVEALVD